MRHRPVSLARSAHSPRFRFGPAALIEALERRLVLAGPNVNALSASLGFGRFIGEVEALNTFTASVSGAAARVEFSLGGQTLVDNDPSNGWQATFNMGDLSSTSALQVVAFSASNEAGTGRGVNIVAVPPPSWVGDVGDASGALEFQTNFNGTGLKGYHAKFKQYTEASFMLTRWMPVLPPGEPGPYRTAEDVARTYAEYETYANFYTGKTGFAVQTSGEAFIPLNMAIQPTVAPVAHLDVYYWLWGVGWGSTKHGNLVEQAPPDVGHILDLDIDSNRTFTIKREFLGIEMEASLQAAITLDSNLVLGYRSKVDATISFPMKEWEWNLFKERFTVKVGPLPVPLEVRLDGGLELGYEGALSIEAKHEGGVLTVDRRFTHSVTFTPSLTASIGLPMNIAKIGVKASGELKLGIQYNNGDIAIPASGGIHYRLVINILDGLFKAQATLLTIPLFDSPNLLTHPVQFGGEVTSEFAPTNTISQTQIGSNGPNATVGWAIAPEPGAPSELYTTTRTPQGQYSAPQVVGTVGHSRDGLRIAYMGSTPVAIWSENTLSTSQVVQSNATTVFGSREIYFARYLNGSWEQGTRLTTNTLSDSAPAFAFSPDGQSGVATWVRHVLPFGGVTSDTEIFASRWDGTSWSAEFRLSDNAVEDTQPLVTCLPDGTFMVSWRRRFAGQDALPYRLISNASIGPEDFVMISQPGQSLEGVTVTLLSDDTLLYAYTRVSDDTSQKGGVELRNYSPDTGEWSNPVQVTSIEGAPTQLALAELDGVIAVAYAQSVDGFSQILATFADFNLFPDQKWSTPVLVTQGQRGFLDLSARAIQYAQGLPGGRLLLSYSGSDRYGEGAPLQTSRYITEISGDGGAQMAAIPFAPDLVASSVQVHALAASDLAAGKVRLRVVVENFGAGASEPSMLQIVNGAQSVLASVALPSIGVGERREFFLDVAEFVGASTLTARVDPGNTNVEMDETNNDTPLVLNLGPPARATSGPDLVTTVTSKLPLGVIGGKKTKVSVKILNRGTEALSESVNIQVFVVAGSALGAEDPAGSLVKTLKLKVNKSTTQSVTFTYPTTLADGDYRLVARAVRTSGGPDMNPADNIGASAATVFVATPYTYLLATVNPPKNGAISIAQFKGSLKVFNFGNVRFNSTMSGRLYISSDATLDAGDIDAATITDVPLKISVGKSTTLKFTVPFALPITAGNYWLFFLPDGGAAGVGTPVLAS